jgi:hypothetical protein
MAEPFGKWGLAVSGSASVDRAPIAKTGVSFGMTAMPIFFSQSRSRNPLI